VKLGLSIIPRLPGIASSTTWKFLPAQYFQVVQQMLPYRTSDDSYIKNVFGTVVTPVINYNINEKSGQLKVQGKGYIRIE
jgi:hypothetical protein